MILNDYIAQQILPQYDHFDPAHRRDHALAVIERSLQMAKHYAEVDERLVLVAAACHDIGLCAGREFHHLESGKLIRADRQLATWFTPQEIELIAQAAEDHRASAKSKPRSIYGMIVAEADRIIVPHTVLKRAVQYGLEYYPELSRTEQYDRMMQHVTKKYGEGGYLHLWLPESPNAEPLKQLRQMIKQPQLMQQTFEQIMAELQS